MFISIDQIKESLKYLKKVDSFWGITFLKFKQLRLPVGNTIEVSLHSEIEDFLEKYYKPCKESAYFYKYFGLPKTKWIKLNRYVGYLEKMQPFSTEHFIAALIHQIDEDAWGWKDNYIEILKSCLYKNQVIPIFYLAVWIYREKEWSSKITPEDIIEHFKNDFLLNEEELHQLFDISIPEGINRNQLFQDKVVSWKELKTVIGKPPDILPEEGTLTYLEIQGVGAAKKLCFEPAERLSLITGDNGFGKTFLLECAWWA